MGTEDQKVWDKRHGSREGREEPSSFLKEVFAFHGWRIQPGRALDIATGKGRNAIFLAERGFQVEAVDISEVGLQEARRRASEKNLPISFRQADLDSVEFSEAVYNMVLNFNFLLRSLIPKIKKALKPGGYVIFETYLIDQRVLRHPRNPAYLLGHNELLEFFRDFRALHYREGKFYESGEEAYRAGLFGQKVR
jgi:2-polyprenyl-3-methyl-5-hydroxy-6-metoxy-1,4-benzoquinol methylase